jgi:hypothetical protein
MEAAPLAAASSGEDEDPVEEFIKSLPEPVQKCVSALDTLDEEICGLETQFRKDLRDLERKVIACSLLWRVAPHMATSAWCS